jgi:hypothetical protein
MQDYIKALQTIANSGYVRLVVTVGALVVLRQVILSLVTFFTVLIRTSPARRHAASERDAVRRALSGDDSDACDRACRVLQIIRSTPQLPHSPEREDSEYSGLQADDVSFDEDGP